MFNSYSTVTFLAPGRKLSLMHLPTDESTPFLGEMSSPTIEVSKRSVGRVSDDAPLSDHHASDCDHLGGQVDFVTSCICRPMKTC